MLDNNITYSVPDFHVYHVRDRASWSFYRDRMTPGQVWSQDRIEAACRGFDSRTLPLVIAMGSTWGGIRELIGPENASTVLYDDPALAREMVEWQDWKRSSPGSSRREGPAASDRCMPIV